MLILCYTNIECFSKPQIRMPTITVPSQQGAAIPKRFPLEDFFCSWRFRCLIKAAFAMQKCVCFLFTNNYRIKLLYSTTRGNYFSMQLQLYKLNNESLCTWQIQRSKLELDISYVFHLQHAAASLKLLTSMRVKQK